MADKPNYKDQVETWMFERQQPAKVADVKEGLPDIPATSVYQSLSKLWKEGVLDKIGSGEYVYADPQPASRAQEAPAEPEKAEAPTTEPSATDEAAGEVWTAIHQRLLHESEVARQMQVALELQTEKLGRLVGLLEEAKGL
jgi:hypothetical protein